VQNGQISADGLTYTFTIRQGVRFADGTPLTPQDVEYSIERALTINLPTSYVNPSLVNELTAGSTSPAVISNAVTVNGWNVTFHLLTPYTPFLQVIAGLDPTYVVSKNYVISHNGWDPANPSVNWSGKEDTWMERHAMGTGPYYLSEWQPSQRMVFLANPYYWRGSPTNITTVVLIIAPETSTRIALLKAGDADEADITPAYLSQISGQAGIDIISGGKTAFIHFIGFSQNINMSAVPCCDIGINATFFSDKHLRLAFNYAMPYEQYLQAAYKGYAVRYNSPIPSPLWANDPSVPLYPFNQTKAAEEFKLAWGGTLSNPGPVWQNGFTTTIYVEPNDEMLVRGQMLAQSLLQINPKFIVKTQTMDIGPETTLSIENGQPMWMYWWGGYFWDPDVDATAMMASYGWRSIQGEYYNATVDALVAQAASEPDQAKRYQLYQQVQWAAYYDVPVITCEQLLNFHVFRSWMGGYVFNPAEARQADRWAWLTKG
jgi:peptide/nickel transport system substrate-binding protein